jgi:hypothetical protein
MAFGSKKKGNFAVDCRKGENNKSYVCDFQNSQQEKSGKIKVQASKDGQIEPVRIKTNENISREERNELIGEVESMVQPKSGSGSNNPQSRVRE